MPRAIAPLLLSEDQRSELQCAPASQRRALQRWLSGARARRPDRLEWPAPRRKQGQARAAGMWPWYPSLAGWMRWRGLFSTFEESLWLSNQAALLFQTFDATLQFKDFFDDAKFSFGNLLSDFRTEVSISARTS